MILLFIGPSGSGKDTQAEMLSEKFNFERVSSGDLLRDISDGDHKVQKMIRDGMNEGFLGDDLVYSLIGFYLDRLNSNKVILSGVVRRNTQISLLDKTLENINKKIDRVLYFELNDEEAVKRMGGRLFCPKCSSNYHEVFNPPKASGFCDNCGAALEKRKDDNPEAIRKRLEAFHLANDQIIENYEKRGILIKIDASKTIEEIHKDVVEKLGL